LWGDIAAFMATEPNRRPAPVGHGTEAVNDQELQEACELMEKVLGTPEESDAECLRRAEWLSQHGAPLNWGILTVEEIAAIKRAFAALVASRHVNAGEDTERLNWLEATVQGKRKDTAFLRSMFICADPNGDIQLDIKLENVVIAPTLRAAIDQARREGGGK